MTSRMSQSPFVWTRDKKYRQSQNAKDGESQVFKCCPRLEGIWNCSNDLPIKRTIINTDDYQGVSDNSGHLSKLFLQPDVEMLCLSSVTNPSIHVFSDFTFNYV